MIAALAAIEYLGQIADRVFESQISRAAVRIRGCSEAFTRQ